MRFPRFIESFVRKGTEKTSDLYDDKNPFIQALERKKTKKLAERLRTRGELSSEEKSFLEGKEVGSVQQKPSSVVVFERDDTAELVGRILSQMGKEESGDLSTSFESNILKNINIDDTTQVIIPLYLRENDVFRKALHGRIFLLLSEINEKMVSILSGIDIQVQSGETSIITQMYQRMNINGVETTLGDSILHPQMAQLQEMTG